MPNLKFSFNHSPDIRGAKIPKVGHATNTSPIWNNFAFFLLELTADRLRAKFEVSSFNRSRDIRRDPKFQNWVTWPPHDPFWPNFAFFSLQLTAIRLCAKFEVCGFDRSRDIRGVPKLQNWVTLPHMTPFDPILHFFVRTYRRPSACQIWSF